MKKKRVVLFALCVAAFISRGDEKSETHAVLSRTLDAGIAILKNKESSHEQKLDAYNKLLIENCHTDLMAMLALGKAGWTALKAGQRDEFVSTFLSVMTRSYYNKLNQIDVSGVAVDYRENLKTGKTKRTLKTVMKSSGDGVVVDYKFTLRRGRWAVYDLEVEGISLIASYRSQFTDFLKTKSALELLTELKQNSKQFDTDTVVK